MGTSLLLLPLWLTACDKAAAPPAAAPPAASAAPSRLHRLTDPQYRRVVAGLLAEAAIPDDAARDLRMGLRGGDVALGGGLFVLFDTCVQHVLTSHKSSISKI